MKKILVIALFAAAGLRAQPYNGTTWQPPGVLYSSGLAANGGQGFVAYNGSAASGSVPAQWSPSVQWQGYSWDGAASQLVTWTSELQSAGLSTAGGPLVVSQKVGSGSKTLGFQIDVLSGVGFLTTGRLLSTAAQVTAGSGSGVTVNFIGHEDRTTYKVTVTNVAFSAAAKTADVTIATLPAKMKLVAIYADVTATFSGGGESAATMTCGSSAGGNNFLVSFDVFTGAITRGLADANLGTGINRASAIQGGFIGSWTTTTPVSVRLTTTTNNTSALTQGTAVFYLVTEAL